MEMVGGTNHSVIMSILSDPCESCRVEDVGHVTL